MLGLDISERMLERARRETADPAIEYQFADLDQLELPEKSFDLAYSSLSFHYVEDFARLIRAIHTAVVPGGWLVFTIEHPIYTAAMNPHWIQDEEGPPAWPVNRYAVEGERRGLWLGARVRKYHRTIGTTLNTLLDAGFTVRRIEEFAPTPAQIAEDPALAEEAERPMFMTVAADR